MEEVIVIAKELDKNIKVLQRIFKDCQDLVFKKFPIGKDLKTQAYMLYFDVIVDRSAIETTILSNFMTDGRLIYDSIEEMPQSEKYDYINKGAIGTIDKKEAKTIQELIQAITAGDTAILIDGYDTGIIVSTKKYPMRSIGEPENEVVVRGPKDGFTEVYRINTVLIRRRIRDPKLKCKQFEIGTRTKTVVGIMYMDDLARESVIEEVIKNIHTFEIDAILDSGMLSQLIEEKGLSPFALIVPAPLNCFLQASDDYYSRWGIMAITRSIRYIALLISILLPGLYVAVTTFHIAILPTSLALSFAAAREGVPFPAAVEVLIMEIAFELLREAGIRLPGPIGSAIGIVGGLIVGQAAVTANLVSPIIVIIVALTAICSFAIPNDELTSAIRVIKFFVLFLAAVLGFYGFWLAVIGILIHLSLLTSYGIPYLMPYVAGSVDNNNDIEDSIIRMPFNKIR